MTRRALPALALLALLVAGATRLHAWPPGPGFGPLVGQLATVATTPVALFVDDVARASASPCTQARPCRTVAHALAVLPTAYTQTCDVTLVASGVAYDWPARWRVPAGVGPLAYPVRILAPTVDSGVGTLTIAGAGVTGNALTTDKNLTSNQLYLSAARVRFTSGPANGTSYPLQWHTSGAASVLHVALAWVNGGTPVAGNTLVVDVYGSSVTPPADAEITGPGAVLFDGVHFVLPAAAVLRLDDVRVLVKNTPRWSLTNGRLDVSHSSIEGYLYDANSNNVVPLNPLYAPSAEAFRVDGGDVDFADGTVVTATPLFVGSDDLQFRASTLIGLDPEWNTHNGVFYAGSTGVLKGLTSTGSLRSGRVTGSGLAFTSGAIGDLNQLDITGCTGAGVTADVGSQVNLRQCVSTANNGTFGLAFLRGAQVRVNGANTFTGTTGDVQEGTATRTWAQVGTGVAHYADRVATQAVVSDGNLAISAPGTSNNVQTLVGGNERITWYQLGGRLFSQAGAVSPGIEMLAFAQGTYLGWRNASNSADLIAVYVDASNALRLGYSTAYTETVGAVVHARTAVTDGGSHAYTVAAGDEIVGIGTTTAAFAVTVPAAPHVGRTLVVQDEAGTAATRNITVTVTSGLVSGAASKVINTNYGVLRLYSDGTNLFAY